MYQERLVRAPFRPCIRRVAGSWRPFPDETTHKEQIEVKQTTPPSPILPVFFLFFSLLLPAGNLTAASVDARQWEITADKITRYEDPASVIAEGNVILEKKESVTRVKKDAEDARWGGLLGESEETADKPEETVTETKTVTSIKADWLAYDVELGRVKARGNLLIDLGTDELSAESGSIDLKEATGTFENATIIRQEKSMHLEGRVIEKTGELTYTSRTAGSSPASSSLAKPRPGASAPRIRRSLTAATPSSSTPPSASRTCRSSTRRS